MLPQTVRKSEISPFWCQQKTKHTFLLQNVISLLSCNKLVICLEDLPYVDIFLRPWLTYSASYNWSILRILANCPMPSHNCTMLVYCALSSHVCTSSVSCHLPNASYYWRHMYASHCLYFAIGRDLTIVPY